MIKLLKIKMIINNTILLTFLYIFFFLVWDVSGSSRVTNKRYTCGLGNTALIFIFISKLLITIITMRIVNYLGAFYRIYTILLIDL